MADRRFSCVLCHTEEVCSLRLLPCLHTCCEDCLRKVIYGHSSNLKKGPTQNSQTELKDTSSDATALNETANSMESQGNVTKYQSNEWPNSENEPTKNLQSPDMRDSTFSTSDRFFSCPRCSYKTLLSESNVSRLKKLPSFFIPSLNHSMGGTSANNCETSGEYDGRHYDSRSYDTGASLSMNLTGQGTIRSAEFNVHCNICNRRLEYTMDQLDVTSSSSSKRLLKANDSMFCATCDIPLCKNCLSTSSRPQEAGHRDHTVCSLDDILMGRQRYMSSLIGQGKACLERQGCRLYQLNAAGLHLNESRQQLVRLLDLRALELCNLVIARRDALVQELVREHGACETQYARETDSCRAVTQCLGDSLMFAESVFPQDCSRVSTAAVDLNSPSVPVNTSSPRLVHNLLELHSDVTTRLNHLVNSSAANSGAGLDVMSLQLNVHGASSGRWDFLDAGSGNSVLSTGGNFVESGENVSYNRGSSETLSLTLQCRDGQIKTCNDPSSYVKSSNLDKGDDSKNEKKAPEKHLRSTETCVGTSSQQRPTNPSGVFRMPSSDAVTKSESSEVSSAKVHPDDIVAVEKLFGSLVRGVVSCGGPKLIATHSVDVTWPVALVITRSHDFVVAGKTGAFASEGKLLFFDRHGNPISTHHYARSRLPISMVATNNGRVLVSDTSGNVCKFSSCGRLLDEWSKKFQVGRQSPDAGKRDVRIQKEFGSKSFPSEDGSGNNECRIGGNNLGSGDGKWVCGSQPNTDDIGGGGDQLLTNVVGTGSRSQGASSCKGAGGSVRGQGIGSGTSGESSGGSVLGGQMALSPDGQFWVTSGCGRLLKYSTVDGKQMGSLTLCRWSNLMDTGHGHHPQDVPHGTGNIASTESKDSQSSALEEVNGKISMAVVSKGVNRKDTSMVKQDLKLDINALAVDSNGSFSVSVLDRKAVYMFTPSGELTACYPASITATPSGSKSLSSKAHLIVETTSIATKVTSEIADGWEMVDGGSPTGTVDGSVIGEDSTCSLSWQGDCGRSALVEVAEVSVTVPSVERSEATGIGAEGSDVNASTQEINACSNISPNGTNSQRNIKQKPGSSAAPNFQGRNSDGKRSDGILPPNASMTHHEKNIRNKEECGPSMPDRKQKCDDFCDISVPNSAAMVELKCPTALCCDPFGNILVADFTADSIHLVSPSGRFLGHFVTSTNGVSCPNFVSLNADASLLYVGQYGGEVLVYQYLSYVKRA